jgi:hypothetical protein
MCTTSPFFRYQLPQYHTLPTHTNTSAADTTAPAHFTLLRILGCGFTGQSFAPATAAAGGGASHSGQGLVGARPARL